MLFKRIILIFILLVVIISILVGCTKNEEKQYDGSDDPAIVVTEDGRAVFDGKIYEKYTVIE